MSSRGHWVLVPTGPAFYPAALILPFYDLWFWTLTTSWLLFKIAFVFSVSLFQYCKSLGCGPLQYIISQLLFLHMKLMLYVIYVDTVLVTMTKATYKRVCVCRDYRSKRLESMTIKHCSRYAGVALEQHLRVQGLRYNHQTERLQMAWVFQTSKSALSDTPPPVRLHLLILSKQSHQWESKNSNI